MGDLPEIVVADRAATEEEAKELTERYEKSLKSLAKHHQFKVLPPQKIPAGRNTHWEIRIQNLVVAAERMRREEEEKQQQREANRQRMSEARKGKPLPAGAGRQPTLYRAFGESKTIAEWAEEAEISEDTLRKRLRRGMSLQEALTRPLWQR